MIAALFPGQGSQIVGMGRAFYDTDIRARELFGQADGVLKYELSKLCFEGPLETLTLTENAQPALLVSSYAAYLNSGIKPDAAAGHSLGEYTALVAAGSLNFIDAVQLVHKRGKYMQQAVEPGAGKMVAVLGSDEGAIREAISNVKLGIAEIANLNCPGQTVVAGDLLGIDEFVSLITPQGGKTIALNVSAPFHCSLMQRAASLLAVDLDKVEFQTPEFPVYSNVTAQRISSGSEARELLKKQVCQTVRWTELMQNMIRAQQITQAFEFGPGGVLSKLLKRIDNKISRTEISDPQSLAAWKEKG